MLEHLQKYHTKIKILDHIHYACVHTNLRMKSEHKCFHQHDSVTAI